MSISTLRQVECDAAADPKLKSILDFPFSCRFLLLSDSSKIPASPSFFQVSFVSSFQSIRACAVSSSEITVGSHVGEFRLFHGHKEESS